jgi:cupin superfamily acireductone dioxygenase involved in methionine salvage
MKIIRSRKFQINLLITLQYIATDKVSASKNFQKELDNLIKKFQTFHTNTDNQFILTIKM